MRRPHNSAQRHSPLPWIVKRILSVSVRDADVREGLLGDLEQEFQVGSNRRPGSLVHWIGCCSAALALALRFAFSESSDTCRSHGNLPQRRLFSSGRLADLGNDVRCACRSLTKSRGYFFVTVFSLALGIGVNTALLGVTGALLQPVPGVTRADQIIEILSSTRGGEAQEWAYPDFEAVRNADTPIAELAGSKQRGATLLIDGVGQSVQVVYVSANYFRALGVGMSLGRDFFPNEDVGPGLNSIVILSTLHPRPPRASARRE